MEFTNESIAEFLQNEIYNTALSQDNEIYKKILSFLDLTTLEGADNTDKVVALCNKARSYNKTNPSIPNVAAVCVYPTLVKTASQTLASDDISIASVAGAFPSGQSPLQLRLDEVKYAIDQGADEIDMVISRGKFLEGDYAFLEEEVMKHKAVCGNVHLKVILETGELDSPENIYRASKIAIGAGADFIKTSTGKVQPAATLEASYVMLYAIKESYEENGKMIGFKPAGGISEPEDAIKYYHLVKQILGDQWLDKKYFRIGASRLADKVFAKLT
jgi:deoxyribose-phosphate aldolase